MDVATGRHCDVLRVAHRPAQAKAVAYIHRREIDDMAMRVGALYDALLEAKVPEETARLAAEEIASVNREQIDLRGECSVVKWMLRTMIALQIGTIGTNVGFAVNHLSFR